MAKIVITFIYIIFLCSCSILFDQDQSHKTTKEIKLSKDVSCFLDEKNSQIKCLTSDSTCLVYSLNHDIKVKCKSRTN